MIWKQTLRLNGYRTLQLFTCLLVIFPLFCQCRASGARNDSNADSTRQVAYKIKLNPEQRGAKVDPRYWGTNFLFWIEDDQAIADGQIAAALEKIPRKVLRYPGGTVADNFHWETNMLDNHCMFPYEEGETESDFDEFMSFCNKIGAEPILVVNTQSWFLQHKIEEGAQEAADWVRYCKEKGYRIKYWEIGNETYWHPVMTAKEYGALVNVYAKAMKAVDPDILVSANGHWDPEMVGTKERMDSTQWENIRQMYLQIKSTEDYKAVSDYKEKNQRKPNTSGPNKWWTDVLSVCGDNIDMVSVHWYYHDNQVDKIDKRIIQLKKHLKKLKPEKDYLFCLTEYNCNSDGLAYRITGLAEGIGRFLTAGVDLACFWPLRIGGASSAEKNRNMLGMDDKQEQYPQQIYTLFAHNLKGEMIACDTPEEVHTFAAASSDGITAVVSGRKLKKAAEITLDPGCSLTKAQVTVTTYGAPTDAQRAVLETIPTTWENKNGKIKFTLPPLSFTMITINQQ